ncbi:hypothetical protein [Methylobacterium pseudosasicola]|uniref:Uncharacterized protein n=1 Tax=Methylobacterium pseudosasicola TaxID=582667 RepID=A0A1I4URI8_9HYPH|nr:hypothetical protein [Methylobacterium pseudosasicola]SFM91599.1 hypothetical protein SAMN05192568_107525 [Methylobacterium pseudosasicola]
MSAAQTLPREERLRTTAHLRDSLPWPISKWRGTSGRTYAVTIRSMAEVETDDLPGAVVIAVRRDGTGNSKGLAQPVRVSAIADAHAARAFQAGLPRAVSELHLHRIEPDARERARIVADLQPE